MKKVFTIILSIMFCITLISCKSDTNIEKDNNITKLSGNSSDDISIYFYPFGSEDKKSKTDEKYLNANSEGDTFIIVIGDIEILVDGGNETNSCDAIKDEMRKHVSSDNVWDYIIVTHADRDHIAAFTTIVNNTYTGIFSLFLKDNKEEPEMTLLNLIDFDITSDETVKYPYESLLFANTIYLTYKVYREKIINTGTKYIPASLICWEKRGLSEYSVQKALEKLKGNVTEIPSDKIQINDKTELQILYNYYYDHKFNPETVVDSCDRNNLSVCFSINYKLKNDKIDRFLFTGDLEEYNSSTPSYSRVYGETKLIENYPELKEGVKFYKAGHHGSRTSSSATFIDDIRPEYVVISAIAGNNSYRHDPNSDNAFPATDVLTNLFKYTDRIYIPSVAVFDNGIKTGVENYYGRITVTYDNGEMNVTTSNLMNNDEPEFIQNTEWFKKYRYSALSTYSFSGCQSEDKAYIGSCTLVKYGHYDVLIDCGVFAQYGGSAVNTTCFIDKIKKYVVDGTIEYVIVSTPNSDSIQQLIDLKSGNKIKKGILNSFNIENIIDFGIVPDITNGADNAMISNYKSTRNNLINKGTKYFSIQEIKKHKYNKINVCDNLDIKFLDNKYYGEKTDNGLCFFIEFYNKKLLFTGNISDVAEKYLVENNDISNVVFYKVSDYGYVGASSKLLLNKIKSNDLFMVVYGIAKKSYSSKITLTEKFINDLLSASFNKTYIMTEQKVINGKYVYDDVCGDITFNIYYRDKTYKSNIICEKQKSDFLKENDKNYNNYNFEEKLNENIKTFYKKSDNR